MILRPYTYTAWWDLHAWAGVVSSMLVYVMFFFGTITLFNREVQVWQEPRGPIPTHEQVDRIIDAAIAKKELAPTSPRVNFANDDQGFTIDYETPGGEDRHAFIERTGLVEPRSNVSDFLYGMHYLQFTGAPEWLYTVAGLTAGLLVLVVVSGVLIHVRHLVRQFHRFRPTKPLRVVWSDAHKVLGTIGLPFALVYGFTGAWLALEGPLSEHLTKSSFRGDEAAVARALRGPPEPSIEVSAETGTRLPLARLRQNAEVEARRIGAQPNPSGGCRAAYLNAIGKRDALATFYCGDKSVVLRQHDGALVAPAESAPPTITSRVQDVPYEMHFVSFAKMPFRVLYALLGLAGCLTILTGNWLWLARRSPSRGVWLVQRSTLMVGGGSLVATASLFVASRFLISAVFERQLFWSVWLVACSASVVGKNPRVHWSLFALLSGLGLLSAPLIGIFTRGLPQRVSAPATVERAVDATLIAIGLSLLLLARALWFAFRAPPRLSVSTQRDAHVP